MVEFHKSHWIFSSILCITVSKYFAGFFCGYNFSTFFQIFGLCCTYLIFLDSQIFVAMVDHISSYFNTHRPTENLLLFFISLLIHSGFVFHIFFWFLCFETNSYHGQWTQSFRKAYNEVVSKHKLEN